VLVRLRYVGVQGYPGDVRLFMEWGERVANNGPWGTYAPTYFLDYPPGYLWVLGLFAKLLDGEALRLAVKAASIPADVALALAFAAILWRRAGPWRAAIAAWLWMLAPGAVIAGPYWGQADAVGTLVVLGALYYASQKRWIVAGALGALAALTKFQFGLALFAIVVAATVEAWRSRSWRPVVVLPAALVANVVITLPFGLGPLEQWDLLKFAGNEYPFTSLYAFNVWAIQPGFWKPDDGLVVLGGIFLAVACIAAVVPLWWRRDLATLLAAGAIMSLAFYFLPTRAHERYLFPAVALLVPFAAARWRTVPSWLVLSIGYAVTLVFALVRTVYTDVTVPASIDAGLFGRTGQIWIAVAMCLAAATSAVLVATVDRSLNAHPMGWSRWLYAARVRASERIVLWRDSIAARIVVEREHERRVHRAVLAVVLLVPMLFNAVALLPEITIAIPSNNDDANHFMYVKEADDALGRGANPFDFWAPEMEFGFPPFVYYQHLPHLAVVALSRVTFGLVDLLTLFNIVRWLLLVLLPVSVWWSLRRIGVPAPGAVLAGSAAALVSGDGRFGIEYDSFVWRGWGMYTQLWGVHLTFIGLALLHDLLERGRGLVRTIVVLSALALSHLIWAYMAAISAFVIFVIGLRRASWRVRIVRLALAGVGTAVLTSYMWLPFLMQRQYLNVSQPYLPEWRFDSFGFGEIARWFLLGELLDHGRIPVLTLFVVAGVIAAARVRDRLAALAVALAAVWVVLWSGRTSLGAVADLLPFSHGLHVHRFVGGVDVAAVLLIGLAGAAVWQLARADASPRRAMATGALMLALLVPAMAERADYYGWNTTWMSQTRDAITRDQDIETLVEAFIDLPPGRVYAGMNNNDWQRSLDLVPFNSVRLPDLLNAAGVPRMAKPYASLSLDADLAFSFDPNDRGQWDLFNVRYAVGRVGQTVPAFLAPLRTVGKYVIYAAPTSGWVSFAQSYDTQAFATDERLFFDLLETIAPARTSAQRYTTYRYPAPETRESAPIATCFDGRGVAYERMQTDRYDALLGCPGNFSLVILKVTYHPNWRVAVDDKPVETTMVSPGFIGFQLPPGQHFVTAQYLSTPLKAPLLWLGLVGAIVLALFRRYLVRPPYTW
jgi:Gpi18-like mannosyltransferase